MTAKAKRSERGFSMLELLVVVIIVLVVGAMAVPVMMNGVRGMRVRATASEVAGLLQQARMRAVRDNTYYTVVSGIVVEGGARRTRIFIDLDDNGTFDTGEPLVLFPANVHLRTSGNPSTASMKMGFDPADVTTRPSFNARGLPCTMSGAVCQTGSPPIGFRQFIAGPGLYGEDLWASVTVTPSGRVKSWAWSKTAWEN